MWTVKLDGADRADSFPDLLLHATEDADWDRAYVASQPQQVEEAVPLEGMERWVVEYCSLPDKPVRLVRHLPRGHLWFTVLSKDRTVDSLSDEEVDSLKYLLKGGHRGGR